MIREERTNHALNTCSFIFGAMIQIEASSERDGLANTQPFRSELGNTLGFHGTFWSNVEMDLGSGHFIEREQLLPTQESLYHMTESKWMAEHLKDDLAVQLSTYGWGLTRDLDHEKIDKLAALLDFSFDWSLQTSRGGCQIRGWGNPAMTCMQIPGNPIARSLLAACHAIYFG